MILEPPAFLKSWIEQAPICPSPDEADDDEPCYEVAQALYTLLHHRKRLKQRADALLCQMAELSEEIQAGSANPLLPARLILKRRCLALVMIAINEQTAIIRRLAVGAGLQDRGGRP